MGLSRTEYSVLSCSLAGLLAGVNLSQFSGLLDIHSFDATFKVNASAKSSLSALLLLGAIIGTPVAGPLVESVGRRRALLVSGTLFLFASVCISGANAVVHIGLGRVLAGCAYAVGNLVAPAYLAEVAPATSRALYVNLYQLSINIGIFGAQFVNAFCAQSLQWRRVAFLPAPFALLLLLLVYTRFEPRSTAPTAATDGARAALRAMWSDSTCLRRLAVAVGLMVAQQLTGVNGVILYAPALIKSLSRAPVSQTSHFWSAAIIGFANFVAGALAMGAIERTGRRQLLKIGGTVICLALCIIAFVRSNGGPGALGVLALTTFIVAFAVSFGPLPFLISAEVLPHSYRALGLMIVGVAAHSSAFSVVYVFLQAEKALGQGVYTLFAATTIACVVFVHAYVPETQGLALEQIDAIFFDSVLKKGDAAIQRV